MPEQPLPIPGKEDVTEALIAELRQRQAKGIETYGTSLMTHNGRSALRDALDEALDLAQYLKQALMEQPRAAHPAEYDRDLLGRAAFEAMYPPQDWSDWEDIAPAWREDFRAAADVVIAAYEASRPVLDLDMLARLAIAAHGIVLQKGDNGTMERYKQMLAVVLPAAYPVERGMVQSYCEQWQAAAEEAQEHCYRANDAERINGSLVEDRELAWEEAKRARRWAKLWRQVAYEMKDRAVVAEMAWEAVVSMLSEADQELMAARAVVESVRLFWQQIEECIELPDEAAIFPLEGPPMYQVMEEYDRIVARLRGIPAEETAGRSSEHSAAHAHHGAVEEVQSERA